MARASGFTREEAEARLRGKDHKDRVASALDQAYAVDPDILMKRLTHVADLFEFDVKAKSPPFEALDALKWGVWFVTELSLMERQLFEDLAGEASYAGAPYEVLVAEADPKSPLAQRLHDFITVAHNFQKQLMVELERGILVLRALPKNALSMGELLIDRNQYSGFVCCPFCGEKTRMGARGHQKDCPLKSDIYCNGEGCPFCEEDADGQDPS
jgi:hypothetical protein